MTSETMVQVTEEITNGQQDRSDYTAEADLARNIASYVSNQQERRCVYLCAKEHLEAVRRTQPPADDATVERVERVARALMGEAGETEEHSNGLGGYVSWRDYEREAKAAIAAWNTRLASQPVAADDPFAWTDKLEWHEAAHRAVMANISLGRWMSAALDDPTVCDAMKADINEWFSAGEPMETLGQALDYYRGKAARAQSIAAMSASGGEG